MPLNKKSEKRWYDALHKVISRLEHYLLQMCKFLIAYEMKMF